MYYIHPCLNTLLQTIDHIQRYDIIITIRLHGCSKSNYHSYAL